MFLMADGQFVYGRPVKSLAIGEEGYFYPLTVQKKRNWLPIVAPAIPIFAMLILFFSTLLPAENAFAYVQLEMESSIEFGVDSAYHVTSIRELDEGGKKLITQLGTWKGEELGELIERSIAISIGQRNEEVTITTATDENGETLDQLVLNASAAAVKQDINVHLKKATFSQRDQSIEENIPVGQKVEHFVSLVKEDKSKMDRDSKKNSENYLKALKVRNEPTPLIDQVIDTKTTSKSDASEQKTLDKGEPKERNEEPKASSKVEEPEKSNKAEKAKPAVKDTKPKTSDLKQETPAEPVEKLKPIVKDEPEKILDKILEKTPLKEVDNQESQPEASKEKQTPKSIIVDNVQERLLEETVYPKSRKPVIEKVIDDQLMKQDTLEKSLLEVIKGVKQEQK